jgi:hypothetical protein
MNNEISLRETLGNALRYWELRRIAYNAVLGAIVLAFFVSGLPESRETLSVDLAQGLFILAVLANVAYCAAYPVDVFAQLSSLRANWLRVRWLLFMVGVLFAGIITRFIAEGIFRGAV